MQFKNPLIFSLLAILLIGGSVLPAMSQTEPEEQIAYIDLNLDKSIYDLNKSISISGQIVNFVPNRDKVLNPVEITFVDPMGRTVTTSGYDRVQGGAGDKDSSVVIPIKFKANPDQSGNFSLSTVLNLMIFDYGSYAVKASTYQSGDIIVATSDFEISSVAEDESIIEEEQVPIEFDVCKSLREVVNQDNVLRDLIENSNVIECSGDNYFTTGKTNIMIIKGKIDPNLTTAVSQVFVSVPFSKPMKAQNFVGWVTTDGTPVKNENTELIRDMTLNALPDKDGNFSGYFEIRPGSFLSADYKITANYLGHKATQTVRIIDETITPDSSPELVLTTNKDEYVLGEIVQISGKIVNSYAVGNAVTILIDTPDNSDSNHPTKDVEKKILPDQGILEHVFSWGFQLGSDDFAIGKYTINAGNSLAESELSFFVIEDTLATQIPPSISEPSIPESSTSQQTIPKKVIEKFNRISDSDILISLDEKKIQDSELMPRVIQASLFTSARGQESDVNIQVSTSDGVCVIGQDTSCMVNESTRKPGAIYEIVTIDEQNYKIRYSGTDVRLEKFSVLPESSGIPIDIKNWNVQIIKDDQPTRFYYKVSYVNLE